MARYLAVCFDLDGVLVDTMPLHAKAWKQAAKKARVVARKSFIYEREGEPGRVTARLLLSRRGLVSEKMVIQMLREKERRFQRLVLGVQVRPTFEKLVKRLSEASVPTALVTGTSKKEVRRMLPGYFLRLFRVVVTGDQVRHGKPHPGPYRTAFCALGVPAGRVVVVENAPFGIQSAKKANAGLVIALASSLPEQFLAEADLVFRSIRRLSRLLLTQVLSND